MDNSANNKEFNIKEHLKGLMDYYCPDMSSKARKSIFGRIKKSKPYEVLDIAKYPTIQDHADAYPEDSPPQKAGVAITNELLNKFKEAGSKAGNDLKELLDSDNTELEIRIRTKWDHPNASAAFQKSGKEGEKTKLSYL